MIHLFMCLLEDFLMSAKSPSNKSNKQLVHIIGDGCAALSLGSRASELPNHLLTIASPYGAPEAQDHIWGFWGIDGLNNAKNLARHKWHNWSVITANGNAVLTSNQHAYYALQRKIWETSCRELAQDHGVKFVKQENLKHSPSAQILDSRPPTIPKGQMIQYFIGWEINTPKNSFDNKTAILMDFRCDQSRGIHFIYLLPFSDSKALVESTMFAPKREPDVYFEAAISDYLSTHCGIREFTKTRIEKGAIPLGRLPRRNSIHGIGSNGNAIKPSTGYAFTFIQKQVSTAIASINKTAEAKNRADHLVIKCPHKAIDLLMDEVFVTVLRYWPEMAPEIFMNMAQALNGDEFAIFLSGEACWKLRLKVVLAMPKWIFIKAVSILFFYRCFINKKTSKTTSHPGRGD